MPGPRPLTRVIVSTVQRIPPRSVDPTAKNYHWNAYWAWHRDPRYSTPVRY